MLTYIFNLLFSLILCSSFYLSAQEPDKKLIGIIIPMQHKALDDMATGFQDELSKLATLPNYEVRVVNAQGDLSLQMALIKNLMNSHCEIYVPIGTATTQMTLQTVKQGKIVALAANLPKDVQTLKNIVPTTGILDEVSLKEQLDFLKPLFPELKKFTVIHSGAEKIHEELEDLKTYSKQHNLNLQILMAQTMTDLATCVQSIDKDSQMIFILKDHLIVSGINLLIKQAASRKIPLVVSDEGSVKSGATFALGVPESEIGRDGARVVFRVLNGVSPKDIPISPVKEVQIFINPKACNQQGINPEQVKQVANQLNYTISICSEEK